MKLKTLIKFECFTSLKSLAVFYAILYGIILFGYFIAWMIQGHLGGSVFSGTEMACMIYLGILGSLGFNEDFKFFMQNGFTRKSILFGTLGMFGLISLLMAVVDTCMATLLVQFTGFAPLFKQIYGSGHSILIQFIWLLGLYFLVSSLMYLLNLISNKIGKKIFYFILITLGLVLFVVTPLLFNLVLPRDLVMDILYGVLNVIGYRRDSTIQFLFPILTILVVNVVVMIGSYYVIKKTELKA